MLKSKLVALVMIMDVITTVVVATITVVDAVVTIIVVTATVTALILTQSLIHVTVLNKSRHAHLRYSHQLYQTKMISLG